MTGQINDLWVSYLKGEGYTGKGYNDLIRQALQDQASSTKKHILDLWLEYLGGEGYSGSLQDRMYTWLGDKGYTGSLDDRLKAGLLAGDLFSLNPSSLFDNGENGYHFEGKNPDTMYSDDAGTTLAIDGDYIRRLKDLSPNGNDALALVNRVKLLSGRSSMVFNNNASGLTSPSLPTGSYYIYYVPTSGNCRLLFNGGNAGWSHPGWRSGAGFTVCIAIDRPFTAKELLGLDEMYVVPDTSSTGSLFYPGSTDILSTISDYQDLFSQNPEGYNSAFERSSIQVAPIMGGSLGQSLDSAFDNSQVADITNIDFSGCRNMFRTFFNCGNLTSFPTDADLSQCGDFTSTWQASGLTSFDNTTLTKPAAQFINSWANTPITSFNMNDLPAGANVSGAWNGCTNLTSFPAIDMSDVSSGGFFQTWLSCSSLTTFPLITMDTSVKWEDTWQNCSGLTSFPALVTTGVPTFDRTWYSCTGLTSFPLIDTSLTPVFIETWRNCTGLTSFPALDLSSATDLTSALRGCSSLTTIPIFTLSSTPGSTTMSFFLANNVSVTDVPALDYSAASSAGSIFNGCTSLANAASGLFDNIVAVNWGGAFTSCALTQTSVDNILVSMDTSGVTNGTLSINGGTSSAPGAAGTTAASNLVGKGWTVVTN